MVAMSTFIGVILVHSSNTKILNAQYVSFLVLLLSIFTVATALAIIFLMRYIVIRKVKELPEKLSKFSKGDITVQLKEYKGND
jgi:nitrate/nitrite-specific signal transduction histidine kinase